MEVWKDNFLVSDDKSKLDLQVIHNFLSKDSYWAFGVPFEIVQKSIKNSLCFGIYEGKKQIGFARVVSDFTTFAYLCDVFVLVEF
ncbi:GNAT family N-acetyltransferase, partial [bacterium]|nr:GNAT family N-acetyltransferase [bacterium]